MQRIKIDKNIVIDKDFEPFFEYAKDYIIKNNGQLIVKNVKYLREGGRHSGSCDGEQIIIAGKCNKFKQVFVHEFAHFTQAVDQMPLWENGLDTTPFWKWLEKKESKDGIVLWDHLVEIALLERDCELRSLKLIKKFNIPICPKEYAKCANLYLYYYHFCFLKRRWVSNYSKVYESELFAKMPEKIIPKSKLLKIDMDIMKMFEDVLT